MKRMKCPRRRIVHAKSFTACLLVALLTVAYAVRAESGWLESGLDLLRGLTGETMGGPLTVDEIAAGLKEALRVGSRNVVKTLRKKDGFNLDPNIHISLPEVFDPMNGILATVGLSSLLDDLELRLNRAAEAATPKAKDLFLDAIGKMTFRDVQSIFQGPDDAATRYFKDTMSPELATALRPVVNRVLSEVGAIQAYDKLMGRYRALPLVPDIKADLTEHVVQKTMDGIFLYMAREEAAIRKDPAKRTTALLRRVFGSKK